MNIALVPLSLMYAWSTLAVPEGTPGYVGASGNVNTCTAQGFISMVFSLAVPTYYGAFVLQAFMGIKNNFNEQKYVWIEKWIHLAAYLIPSAYAIIIAATNNFNPNGSGCWYAKWPKGCDNSNPEAPQCRGDDIDLIMYIIGFTQIFLYFIFPPVVITSMYCWLRRIRSEAEKSCNGGMLAVRETARREMMQSIYRQISIYLGSFWFIWVPGLISNVYTILTGDMLYNLQIFCNCIFAFQGFVFTVVYFILQTIGRPKINIQPTESQVRTTNITTMSTSTSGCRSQQRLTVSDIRLNAKRKAEIEDAAVEDGVASDDLLAESYCFNIFDGTPDEASPWAQFIDPDSDNEDDEEKERGSDEEQGGIRTGSPS